MSTMPIAAVVASVCLASVAAAQRGDSEPVRNAVVGQVIDQQTSKPVAFVPVEVWGSGGRALTDAEGRFVLRDVPDEPFTIEAGGDGRGLSGGHGVVGQATWNDEPQFISVKPGEVLRGVRIPFWRDGVVTGRVTDETGRPFVGATVQVFLPAAEAGRRQLVPDDDGLYPHRTDHEGRYRFPHAPGGIFIRVATSEWRRPPDEDAGRVETLVFPPVFAPAAVRMADARPVFVKPGAETTVDVQLRAAEGVTVSGVVRADGHSVADANVTLTNADTASGMNEEDLRPDASTCTNDEGHFTIHGVAPGDYLLRAAVPGSVYVSSHEFVPVVDPPTALLRLSVRDHAVGVTIEVRPDPKLSGQYVWDGASKPTIGPEVSLDVSDSGAGAVHGWERLRIVNNPQERPAPTSFETRARLGRRVLTLEDAPAGWMLRSIRLGDRDITDVPIDVTGDISNLVVTLTDRITEIRGHVALRPDKRRSDASVWIFPVDPSRWVDYGAWPSRIQNVSIDLERNFALDSLPAGQYFAIAVSWRDSRRLKDAAVMAAAARLATTFWIAEGERRTLALDVMTLPSEAEIPWSLDRMPTTAAPEATVESQSSLSRRPEGTASIVGRVIASDTGQPVADAVVSLHDWVRPDSGADDPYDDWTTIGWMSSAPIEWGATVALTHADGTFSIPHAAAGHVILRVRAPLFGEARCPAAGSKHDGHAIVVRAGSTVSIGTIEMPRAASLSGTVRDEHGRALAGATVEIERAQGQILSSGGNLYVRTDEHGRYAIFGLQPGVYDYVVSLHLRETPVTRAVDLADPLKPSSGLVVDSADVSSTDSDGRPLELLPGEARTLDFQVTLSEQGPRVQGSKGPKVPRSGPAVRKVRSAAQDSRSAAVLGTWPAAGTRRCAHSGC